MSKQSPYIETLKTMKQTIKTSSPNFNLRNSKSFLVIPQSPTSYGSEHCSTDAEDQSLYSNHHSEEMHQTSLTPTTKRIRVIQNSDKQPLLEDIIDMLDQSVPNAHLTRETRLFLVNFFKCLTMNRHLDLEENRLKWIVELLKPSSCLLKQPERIQLLQFLNKINKDWEDYLPNINPETDEEVFFYIQSHARNTDLAFYLKHHLQVIQWIYYEGRKQVEVKTRLENINQFYDGLFHFIQEKFPRVLRDSSALIPYFTVYN